MEFNLSEEEVEELWRVNPMLAAELAARFSTSKESQEEPSYVKALFGPQYRFYADPSKRKAAVCSRRAGKTEGVAAWLISGGETDPGGLSVYIALTRNNCRLILWRTLVDINARHGLGLRFAEIDNQLNVFLPNGHRIWLAGCKDSKEVDKFRGLKLRRAAIDEGASYGPYLKELVEDALEPALFDLDGELCVIGTPGIIPTGYFFEITNENTGVDTAAAWPTHYWTCENNPYIQIHKLSEEDQRAEIQAANDNRLYINERAVHELEEKLKQKGWSEDHPTYQREWKGIWVRDDGALVFPVDYTKNIFRVMPENDNAWVYGIGCDVGYEDDTAFVVGAYQRGSPIIYIIHAEKKNHMTPIEVAVRLEQLKEKYKATEIVMDTGGIGKGYAETCIQHYNIFVESAEKTKKRAFIEVVRGEMKSGNIKIHATKCQVLLEEMMKLVWNESHTEADERFPDHACDSFTYLVRKLLHFYRPEVIPSELTQSERAKAENEKHKAEVQKRIRHRLRAKATQKHALRKFMAG